MHKSSSTKLPAVRDLDDRVLQLLSSLDNNLGVGYLKLPSRRVLGVFETYLLVIPVGGRLKAHVHDFNTPNEKRCTAETYQVLRGEGVVYTGKMVAIDRYHALWGPSENISPGSLITISPREPHSIKNTKKDPLVMLLYCLPGNMDETRFSRNKVVGGNLLRVYNGPEL